MERLKSLLAIGACGAAVAALGAVPALAGEVTGSDKKIDQNQGKSWCSFSGLNDDPDAPLDGSGPNGPGGKSQSYGQENKLGIVDPHEGKSRPVLQPQPDAAAPAAQPDQVSGRSAPDNGAGLVCRDDPDGRPREASCRRE